jgi:fructose-bisphosphate aldolase/6-deoxy-5-ketofructose 1-phosphate synthase
MAFTSKLIERKGYIVKKLFLFAGDQKIEHLNKNIDAKKLFNIASSAPIGAFATHLGLIDLYGDDYKNIEYVVKLNAKTNLVPTSQRDPISLALHSVEDVVEFRDRKKLKIMGVGYTVYLGSEYESQMLTQAAQIVYKAHREGLSVILWMYPRGKAVKDERDSDLIAGAAGVGASLGADFVKINSPDKVEFLKDAVVAAGRTGVICSGGKKKNKQEFLKELKDQIQVAGTAGFAIGRNIHELLEKEAIEFCKEIAELL